MANGDSPWLALKMSIYVGYYLASEHPEIVDYYRAGMSHRQIAGVIQRNGGFGRKITADSVREHAVQYALTGNDREDAGKVYSGLMDREEYDEISAQHRRKSGERSSTLCKNEEKGIFKLTEEEIKKGIERSCMSRGQVPWKEHEKEDAFSLREDGFTARDIAKKINRHYHDDEPVRNKDAVNGMFGRERRR